MANIVTSDDLDLVKACLTDADFKTEDDVDTYLNGDFWIDVERLYCPSGETIDFYTTTQDGKKFTVVRDDEPEDDYALSVISEFVDTYPNSPDDDTRVISVNACAFVTGEDNVSDPLKYAAKTGHYLIAYRGGYGYCYTIFDMGVWPSDTPKDSQPYCWLSEA